jgi:hypothetical protein
MIDLVEDGPCSSVLPVSPGHLSRGALLTSSLHYRMCYPDRIAKHGNVHWCTSLDGCWKRLGLYRLPRPHHRTRFPHPTSSIHLPLQLYLVPRINCRRMDNIRYFPNYEHLVMANPIRYSGCPSSHPNVFDPLLPRIPSMVNRPRSR